MAKNKENTFVIIPPEKGSPVFLVKPKAQFEKDNQIFTSYFEVLDLILFNREGVLSEKEHHNYLDRLLPSLAMILQSEFNQETKHIVEMFLDSEDEESPEVKAFGSYDYTTSLVFILMKHLSDYSDEVKAHGVDSAEMKYKGINDVISRAFLKVPFYLVSSVSNRFASAMAKKKSKKLNPEK